MTLAVAGPLLYVGCSLFDKTTDQVKGDCFVELFHCIDSHSLVSDLRLGPNSCAIIVGADQVSFERPARYRRQIENRRQDKQIRVCSSDTRTSHTRRRTATVASVVGRVVSLSRPLS